MFVSLFKDMGKHNYNYNYDELEMTEKINCFYYSNYYVINYYDLL